MGHEIDRPSIQEKPWRSSEALRRLHREEGLTLAEMAERWGVAESTVWRNMEKNGIPRLRAGNGKHNDPDWLEEKYYGEELTLGEMAELAGKSKTRISECMDRHGLERREAAHYLRKGVRLRTKERGGYEHLAMPVGGSTHYYPVHRMLAIAEWGLDEVAGKVVHHENGIPWDNRVSNLTLLDSQAEHARLHSGERERNKKGQFR